MAHGCHDVFFILSYHRRSLISERNLSLFNHEKEGEFVLLRVSDKNAVTV